MTRCQGLSGRQTLTVNRSWVAANQPSALSCTHKAAQPHVLAMAGSASCIWDQTAWREAAHRGAASI